MIKVSIIVPCYNCSKFIDRCLDSLKRQSYNNIEIILINDGSTDNTFEILKNHEIEDKRIIVVDKKNEGVSKTRNLGIELSTGDYLMFVDSDDFIDERMIEKMIENYSGFDIIKCGYIKYYNNKKNKYIEICECDLKILNNKEYIYNKLIRDYSLSSSCAQLIKRELFNEVRYDERIKYGEDYLLNLNIYTKSKKIVLLKNCYYYYYCNDESATNYHNYDRMKKRLDDAKEVYNQLFYYLSVWKIDSVKKQREVFNRIVKEINMQLLTMYKVKVSFSDRLSMLNDVIFYISNLNKRINIKKSNNRNFFYYVTETLLITKRIKIYNFIGKHIYSNLYRICR